MKNLNKRTIVFEFEVNDEFNMPKFLASLFRGVILTQKHGMKRAVISTDDGKRHVITNE